jgi:hypothetical protein
MLCKTSLLTHSPHLQCKIYGKVTWEPSINTSAVHALAPHALCVRLLCAYADSQHGQYTAAYSYLVGNSNILAQDFHSIRFPIHDDVP